MLNTIYADDTAMVTTSTNSKVVAYFIRAQLNPIEGFFSSCGLMSNSRKTEAFSWKSQTMSQKDHSSMERNKIEPEGNTLGNLQQGAGHYRVGYPGRITNGGLSSGATGILIYSV